MLNAAKLSVMIDQETLEKRIAEIGQQISKDYEGKELVLVCALRGAVMFLSQLSKSISIPMTMEFMVVSSYGSARVSSGEVRVKMDLDGDITGKHVVIVEDIVDTGRTLLFLSDYLLSQKGAASVKICTMLDKPARRVVPVTADYTGFEVEDKYILGYGLDDNQYYRNLPYIACYENEDEA